MTNLIEEFIYITEVNRIVQGLSSKSGKPKEHIDQMWKDTEKEVLLKHKFGVTDKYKTIGKVISSGLNWVSNPKRMKIKKIDLNSYILTNNERIPCH